MSSRRENKRIFFLYNFFSHVFDSDVFEGYLPLETKDRNNLKRRLRHCFIGLHAEYMESFEEEMFKRMTEFIFNNYHQKSTTIDNFNNKFGILFALNGEEIKQKSLSLERVGFNGATIEIEARPLKTIIEVNCSHGDIIVRNPKKGTISIDSLETCLIASEEMFTEQLKQEIENQLDEIVLYKKTILDLPREHKVQKIDTCGVFQNEETKCYCFLPKEHEDIFKDYLRDWAHFCNKKQIQYHYYFNGEEIKIWKEMLVRMDEKIIVKENAYNDEREENNNPEEVGETNNQVEKKRNEDEWFPSMLEMNNL